MIYFLIPVYNEELNLKTLYNDTLNYMEDINRSDFRFIFVNDGSIDNSLSILKKFQNEDSSIIIISHYPNMGIKTTFLKGFQKFLELGSKGDILITKEADNTSDNSIVDRMIREISENGYDIILASCYMKGGGLESTTIFRTILSFSANLIIKIRFKIWDIHTFSSFYRAFSYNCLSTAFSNDKNLMNNSGFSCVIEMLLKLRKMDFKIIEIPMILKSSKRVGKSKMPILKTILGYFKLCFIKIKY